jgi:hypothetical protein
MKNSIFLLDLLWVERVADLHREETKLKKLSDGESMDLLVKLS